MALRSRFPFWIHVLVETPAAFKFLTNPSEQLSAAAPQAGPIIRQYGALLLVSVLIALIVASRPLDNTGRDIAGALSLYHLLPVNRALDRIYTGASYGKGLGGPWVHFIVHVVCLVSLAQLWVRGIFSTRSG